MSKAMPVSLLTWIGSNSKFRRFPKDLSIWDKDKISKSNNKNIELERN